MFQIRPEQYAELEKAVRTRFHYRVLESLRQHLPRETAPLDDETLLKRIVESDRRAATYGVKTERGITHFAGLTFIAGPHFDEIPEVQKYLRLPFIDPDHKVEVLVDFLAEYQPPEGGA